MTLSRIALAACLALAGSAGARAQTVTDGSDAAVGAAAAKAVLVLLGSRIRDPEARVANLRVGRAGALCGTVDVRNRMGDHAGPRRFVADPAEGFFGRLPEGPELRSPGSPADFQAMQRARALFEANCTAG
ncbi:hypothetical protein [Methylobacterium sp. Leaf118]|uniref:hypothetical protein n=1 Tax=Methylobacterium sp. Leaf118 TaxID=2876562 RepID=UPI001E511794|nr:hypothetical protein [Methylobacterium sp. Leaf118]